MLLGLPDPAGSIAMKHEGAGAAGYSARLDPSVANWSTHL